MPVHKAVVSASIGLHARPAAEFVRAVTATGLPVTIRKAGIQGVDARSLLEVMTADFPFGCEVELSVPESALKGTSGAKAAEDALGTLAALLESQGAAQALPSAKFGDV
ncbi:MAG: HPr family phosphocarrier protein [Cellulosimicrobium cellulans]